MKSLCLELPWFTSRKGLRMNFMGLAKRLFPEGSPAGYPPPKVYVLVVFSPLTKVHAQPWQWLTRGSHFCWSFSSILKLNKISLKRVSWTGSWPRKCAPQSLFHWCLANLYVKIDPYLLSTSFIEYLDNVDPESTFPDVKVSHVRNVEHGI